MTYIEIEIITVGKAYQEVNADGKVVRYLDADGNYLFDSVPLGFGSIVTNPNPARTAWMV